MSPPTMSSVKAERELLWKAKILHSEGSNYVFKLKIIFFYFNN